MSEHDQETGSSGKNGKSGLTRREMIRILGAGALATLLPGAALSADKTGPKAGGKAGAHPGAFETAKAPGIIFVVGDGMPLGVVRAMHEVRTGVFGHPGSTLYTHMRDPKTSLGLMATASLSSIVTDSAPASVAWSTGVKTANRYLATLPDGRKLTTIFELAKPRGIATGVVTTTRVTHATPAAWMSHQSHRDNEDDIALEYLALRPDVILGGGLNHFSPKKRKDGRDLMAEFAKAGYDTATDRSGLLGLESAAKPLLGLFNGSHVAYNVDRLNDPALAAAQPTLPEMTAEALRRLSKNPGGFLLQVEAGRIDHASHSNDAWGAIMDTVELDDTLAVIDEFLKVNPKTLVILTSDHGNSGWGVNGTGQDYNDATAALRSLRAGKASFEVLIKRMKDKNPADIQMLVEQASGFPISLAEAELVHRAMQPGYQSFPGDFVYQPDATLGQLLAHSVYPKQGAPTLRRGNVGFTSCNHTADDQLLLAYGHKSGELGLNRLVDNTALFGAMCRFFGIRHQNPTMTLAEARPHLLAAARDERESDPRLHIA